MQQEVYGEVIQGEIVGVVQPAPVIPTATPVTTQPGFSSEVELGAYKGFGQGFSQVAPSAPPRVIDSGLVLVRAGSPGVLRFDQFQALQAGMAAPLTCHASNPGNGVGTKYPEERTFGEWRYTESKMVAAQNACMAQLVQGKFIKRVDANLVLDVAFWVFQEGTAVNWVGGGSDSRTYLNGGGRDFRVNPDGSICLSESSALVPGRLRPRDRRQVLRAAERRPAEHGRDLGKLLLLLLPAGLRRDDCDAPRAGRHRAVGLVLVRVEIHQCVSPGVASNAP